MNIKKSKFGSVISGSDTDLYTLSNTRGTVLKMSNYGATIVALEVVDRSGVPANIVLGFETVGGYENHDAYFGATIGRFGNRIAGGKFSLGGEDYSLAKNNGTNHLHGGLRGFDRVIWDAEPVRGDDSVGIRFSYLSPVDEEGYPGNLDVCVTYTLNNDDELRIEYSARTDATTIINLTNHSYWNLSAGRSETILDHLMQIEADQFLAIDENMIPTIVGNVAGNEMDFRTPRPVAERIAVLKEDPDGPKGFDHNYVLRGENGKLSPAARVEDPASGRVMEVLTTEPGIQFYSGNFLDGGAANGGHVQHAAFCLETQHFPDSPNRPDFPSVVLEPDSTYQTATIYRFSTRTIQT